MAKQILSVITLACALSAAVTPAWPEDLGQVDSPPAQAPLAASSPALNTSAPLVPATASAPARASAPAAASTSALPSQKLGARIASLPLFIAGCACGTVVGTPICFVRKFPSEFHNLAYGFVGSITDNKSKWLSIPAGIAWLPFSGTATLMEAPVYAFKDAYMAEKPFSKEQFSLGQIDAPDKKQKD
jgi:hypothetical protein